MKNVILGCFNRKKFVEKMLRRSKIIKNSKGLNLVTVQEEERPRSKVTPQNQASGDTVVVAAATGHRMPKLSLLGTTATQSLLLPWKLDITAVAITTD